MPWGQATAGLAGLSATPAKCHRRAATRVYRPSSHQNGRAGSICFGFFENPPKKDVTRLLKEMKKDQNRGGVQQRVFGLPSRCFPPQKNTK